MEDDEASVARLGIIGNPLGHSASPHMYNRLFSEARVEAVYELYQIEEYMVEKFTRWARINMKGFNVTIPYKKLIMKYMDELDELAASIGAVNTVKNNDGMLIGYNTDIVGFTRTLSRAGGLREYDNVLIVGAGGAARSAAYSLIGLTRKVVLASRSGVTAEELARELRARGLEAVGIINDDKRLSAYAPFDLIINASPVGMKPRCMESPVSADLVRDAELVIDLVYNPLKTRLASIAEDWGVRFIDGLWMLVYQGVENLRLWLGLDVDPSDLRSYALEVIVGDYREC
ncbi:MAG: shikimate dehydrogenase [Desulfurococcales archaeon]|nr:shikimate dehydrogenase [Desulfurococcales archaeon]